MIEVPTNTTDHGPPDDDWTTATDNASDDLLRLAGDLCDASFNSGALAAFTTAATRRDGVSDGGDWDLTELGLMVDKLVTAAKIEALRNLNPCELARAFEEHSAHFAVDHAAGSRIGVITAALEATLAATIAKIEAAQ